MDEEVLTPEEAEWIVANRDQIRESGPAIGAVIGPLEGEDAVKLLEEVFAHEGENDERAV